MELNESSCSSLRQQQQLCRGVPQLPTALQLHILSLLPPNERTLSARLVCWEAYEALPDDCSATLAEPLPTHSAPWAQEEGQEALWYMTLEQKLHLLCIAAASGSEVNLEVAWALLQPSIFPELLQSRVFLPGPYPDPGVVAASAGHPQLLGWLVRHCPAMLRPWRVLEAAARHCDMAGLQAAWEALQGESAVFQPFLTHGVLCAAAASATPGVHAKVEWLIAAAGEGKGLRLQDSTGAAAARSGDLGRLRWLRDRGCPLGRETVEGALQHADLSVVQWLVDEVGCELPTEGSDARSWHPLQLASVQSRDGVAKLTWLQGRGCPQLTVGYGYDLYFLTRAAITAGQVEAVRYLLAVYEPHEVPRADAMITTRGKLCEAAAELGDAQMLELLHHAGVRFTFAAYMAAAERGSLDTVRQLTCAVGVPDGHPNCSDAERFIRAWPRNKATNSYDLLEGLQLLVGMGMFDWNRGPGADVLSAAAARGDLDLVQYLLQLLPGVQLGAWTVAAAAQGGCEVLLEWLAEQPGCLAVSQDASPYTAAARNGDRGTLTALWRLGVPWGGQDTVVQAACRECELPAVRWMWEHGAPRGTPEELVRAAAKVEQWAGPMAEWLRGLAVAVYSCR